MDASQRIWVVQVKHTIGEYFFAKIEDKIYAFRLKGKIYNYHHKGMFTIRKMYFTTAHYRPISFENNKELEVFLRANQLPNVDRTLFATLKYLAKREKHTKKKKTGEEVFTPHNLIDLVEEVKGKEDIYSEQVKNLMTYIQHLNVDQIILPCKNITEFLDDQLIATDPKFLGDTILTADDIDKEHKIVTNVPIKGKGPFLKLMVIAALISIIALVGFMAYDQGWFNGLAGGFGGLVPNIGGGPKTVNEYAAKYPTPEALRAAVDRGEVKEADLPPDMKKMLEQYKPPTVTPTQHAIELGK